MKILVADVETTGKVEPIYICEVAWAEIEEEDLGVIEEFVSLVNPGVPIPCDASGIHGIRTADVQDSPRIDEIEFPKESIILVAHQASFDARLLAPYMNIVGTCCTLTLARRLLPGALDFTLPTLSCYCNLPKQLNHRAQNDVRDCLGLLDYMTEGSGMTFQQLYEYSNTPIRLKNMPWGKHKNMPMELLPRGYVQWLAGLTDLDLDMKYTMRELYGVSYE